MTPEEQYYREISQRLRQARVNLHKFCDNNMTEEVVDMIRLIQLLVPEEIDAYNAYIRS